MRLESTLAIYGEGTFWSNQALDSLDGTNKRIGNKTYHFNKKGEHMMVSFNINKGSYAEQVIGKHLDFGIDVEMNEDQTSVLSVSKFKTVRIVSVSAEEGAIALREVQ